MTDGTVDLLIIGGGINGVGIARDAAGRGYSVALCERSDLGGATSSASTKLIHGGLRYLEHYEFRLVREALTEREVLLGNAQHIVWPMRFVLPHHAELRPAWMIRIGLFLYDHIGGRKALPASEAIRLAGDRRGKPLKDAFARGFAYSDCWVDDARLVALNAVAAHDLGARIMTRTAVTAAHRDGDLWRARLTDAGGGEPREIAARMVVNAAGPWVNDVLGATLGVNTPAAVRLIKGSHIVVPQLFHGDHAYIFQHGDGRVVFAIPYEHNFTLIGTTDVPVEGSPDNPRITDDEVAYLCDAVGEYFAKPPTPDSVVWSYSGVRPLYDDGDTDPSAVTRDYVLAIDDTPGPPLLSVYGGKITTYRRLAEEAMDKVAERFPDKTAAAWTETAPLPGGDLGGLGYGAFAQKLSADFAGLDAVYLRQLARRHGSRAYDILADVRSTADLGQDFGGGLFEREVSWLIQHEWAREPADILWRRTKTGLHGADPDALAQWMNRA